MQETDRQLVLELKSRIPIGLQPSVRKLILFGSRVRGEGMEGSDLDLVALVGEKTPALERELDEIAYGVMWDHDFSPIISLNVFSEDRFQRAVERGLSFYLHVNRDGIVL